MRKVPNSDEEKGGPPMTKPKEMEMGKDLEKGDRVVFVRNRFKELKFPRKGMKGRVEKIDPVEDYFIIWDNGSRFCWCYRDELHKLPDRKKEVE